MKNNKRKKRLTYKGISIGLFLLGIILLLVGGYILRNLGKDNIIGVLMLTIGATLTMLFLTLAIGVFFSTAMKPISDKKIQEGLSFYGELLEYGVVCTKCDEINPTGRTTCKNCGEELFERHQPIKTIFLGLILGGAGWYWDKKYLLVIGIVIFVCGLLMNIFVQGYHAWASGKFEPKNNNIKAPDDQEKNSKTT